MIVFEPFNAHAADLFAMTGFVVFVLGSLMPGFLLGSDPLVEVLEEEDRIHRTSSEAP